MSEYGDLTLTYGPASREYRSYKGEGWRLT
jgi:hypothetical protein